MTSNWDNGGSPDIFVAGDNVLFDDTASEFNVAVQAEVFPGSVTFNHSTNDYTVTGAAIGGGGGLTKSGDGYLYLDSANTYTGTTTISGGVIVAGNNAALGSNAGGTVITAGGMLDINNKNFGTEVFTISGDGDGSGALVNYGSDQISALGRLVLGADATIGGSGRWDLRNSAPTLDMAGFTLTKAGSNYVGLVGVAVSNPGDIDVTEGFFSIQTSTTMGGSDANTITARSGAVLTSWQAANPIDWSIQLENGSTLRAESAANGTNNTWTGPVTLEDSGIVTVQADGTMTLSGDISGTGSAIEKTGGASVFVSGTNTYTGLTTVSAGSLILQNSSALGTPAGGTTVANGARVELDDLTITGENITVAGEGGNFFGALQSRAGASVWDGNVSVDATNTRIGAQSGASLEISGGISSTRNPT
ncbi:MAG: autotransporter-associated beta strand repeat-containing protein, partial [Verrucomicrobiae bacterium]|nr:autotransporter-associated beta strand repeat-containing protein [Verrucomicrobiae bacterium]